MDLYIYENFKWKYLGENYTLLKMFLEKFTIRITNVGNIDIGEEFFE